MASKSNLLVVCGVHREEAKFGKRVLQAYLEKYGNPKNLITYQTVNNVSQDNNLYNYAYPEISALTKIVHPRLIVDLHHSKGMDTKYVSPRSSMEVEFFSLNLSEQNGLDKLLKSSKDLGARMTLGYSPSGISFYDIWNDLTVKFGPVHRPYHDIFYDILKKNPKKEAAYLQVELLLSGTRDRRHNNKWNKKVLENMVELIEKLRKFCSKH